MGCCLRNPTATVKASPAKNTPPYYRKSIEGNRKTRQSKPESDSAIPCTRCVRCRNGGSLLTHWKPATAHRAHPSACSRVSSAQRQRCISKREANSLACLPVRRAQELVLTSLGLPRIRL